MYSNNIVVNKDWAKTDAISNHELRMGDNGIVFVNVHFECKGVNNVYCREYYMYLNELL